MSKLQMRNARKILIVKPSSLGDIVHSLPFLNSVKTSFPDAGIHWVVAKGFEGILKGHPLIDKLWIINKDAWKNIKQFKNTAVEIKSLFRALKKEEFDLVVDLQGLLRSGVITAATRSPVRIGFKEAREGSSFFYTHKVDGGKDIHAVDRYLKVAAFIGSDTSSVAFPLPPDNHPASSSLRMRGDYAVIVPGARWKTKRWPPEKFGELAALLSLKSIIVGSKSDVPIANRIVELSGGKAMSLAGKTTLGELIGIMRGTKFVISNDSGPMHIAAALGVPVFAIFGPTDPRRTGPYGKGHTIIKSDVLCAPCFKRSCDDSKCLESLTVDTVFQIIKTKQHRKRIMEPAYER